MYTTYHFKSAADINMDIINAIKTAFKEKPVVITIEEDVDETAFLMGDPNNKEMLLNSIAQDKKGDSLNFNMPDEA